MVEYFALGQGSNQAILSDSCLGSGQIGAAQTIGVASYLSSMTEVWTRFYYDGTTAYGQMSQEGTVWNTVFNQAGFLNSATFGTPLYWGWVCGNYSNLHTQAVCFTHHAAMGNVATLPISNIVCTGSLMTVTVTGSLSAIRLASGHGVAITGVSLASGSIPKCEYLCNAYATCGQCNEGVVTVIGASSFSMPWSSACSYTSGGLVMNLSM
jgi:hypothetical protein